MFLRRSAPVLSISLSLLACAGGQADHSGERARAEDPTSASASASSVAPTPEAPPRPAQPPPVLRVRVHETPDGTFAPAIENRGDRLARISPALILERQQAGAFEEVPSVSVSLRWGCDTPAPECVELAPGAELRPPAWLGTVGDAQCECERCADAPAGSYRFVVTTCDGDHRLEGDVFTR